MSPSQPGKPIVILGAARSGTKFLRDTLNASRRVAATPYDLNYVWRTGNESYPTDALPPDLCDDRIREKIGRALMSAAGLRPGDERRLVEKTVSNTLRVGFVARVLPGADFVHIVRNGRDVTASSLTRWLKPLDLRYLAAKARSFPLSNYRYAFWFLGNLLRPRRQSRGRAVWGVRYPGIDADVNALPVM